MFREKATAYDPSEKAIEVCEICYASGHIAANCPKRKEAVVCKVCGKPGHTALYCPDKEAGQSFVEKLKKRSHEKVMEGRPQEVEKRVEAYKGLEKAAEGEKPYTEAEVIAQVDDFSNQFKTISQKLGKAEFRGDVESYKDEIKIYLDALGAQGYERTPNTTKKVAKLKNTLNMVEDYL